MKTIIAERKEISFYIKMLPLKNHPQAYEKSKSIVCGKSLALLDDAYEKKSLPRPNCQTLAVDENIRFAEKLGITSVPAFILPDGTIIPKYTDARTLIQKLMGN